MAGVYITPTPSRLKMPFWKMSKSASAAPRLSVLLSSCAALGVGIGQWNPGDAPAQLNVGFSDDASLFIIMVSDEDDKSFGPVEYYKKLLNPTKAQEMRDSSAYQPSSVTTARAAAAT